VGSEHLCNYLLNTRLLLRLTSDRDGVSVVFCGVGANNLSHIGESLVKDLGSTPPQVINVFKFV
jgi:hypothetical protein